MSGKYRTIVADPPWDYEGFATAPGGDRKRGLKPKVAALPYGSMTLEEIAALPVAALAHPDGARLFLWTTNRYLRDAFDIADAWGFKYAQMLVWHKTGNPSPFGGSVAPIHAEFLLVAKTEHVSPGPYVEMFARRARFGWDYWGDQSLGTADLGAAA